MNASVLARFQVSHADDGTSLALAIGDELIVALPENPTTGYRWQLDSPGGALVLENDESQTRGVPGADGTRRLRFRAAAPGRVRLHLQLRREWEKAKPPSQEFSLILDVQPR